jgi:tetratricopeptide (TPR) repeat protein
MESVNQRWRTLLIALLIGAATLAAFWPVVHNEFIKFDDGFYVTLNPRVSSGLSWSNAGWAFRTGYQSNWHPLTWLSHMLDVQVFGLRPGWHHLVNLLFHAANAVLLFVLLQRMTGAVWRSAFVAAFFALHPLHVESVAWIAERKDVLSTFFFLLTLWAYVRYVDERREQSGEGREGNAPRSTLHAPISYLPSSIFYLLSLVFFALGLMSKPMLVTLPCVLLLLDWWPLQRIRPAAIGPQLITLLREKAPFFCLALASSVVTFLVQEQGRAIKAVLPFAPRVANAVASYLKYLGKIFWPVDLAIFYPHPDLRFPVSAQWPEWQIVAAALLLVALSWWTLRRLKPQPWLSVGWFWYLGTLVPVIGLVQVGNQAMADRYTYIPLIGIFIALVWGTAEACRGHAWAKPVMAGAGVALVTACAWATHSQVKYWRTNFILFQHALAVTANNAVAHYHVGSGYKDQDNYGLALAHFQAAVRADPSYADGYYGLGLTLEHIGQLSQAVEEYRATLRLRPWSVDLHNHLGALLSTLGKRDEAIREFQQTLQLSPDFVEAHYNVGVLLSDRGDFSGAASHFGEVVRLKPDDTEARAQLAAANAHLQRTPQPSQPAPPRP